MTKKVFVSGINIITPLGLTAQENWDNMYNGRIGISRIDDSRISKDPFCASMLNSKTIDEGLEEGHGDRSSYTKLEKMLLMSIKDAAGRAKIDVADGKTLIIISTTKGNIDLIDDPDNEKIFLWSIGRTVQDFFGCLNPPLILSAGCISGTLAILCGYRFLRASPSAFGEGLPVPNESANAGLHASKYENIIVSGADIISSFVVSGFRSLKALSSKPCRPFDAMRDGITPGEGAGTVILTSQRGPCADTGIVVSGGSCSNDANHISAPSRTGDGLYQTVVNTLKTTPDIKSPQDIDYIMAHGTATVYNDEMESKVIASAKLCHCPLNSIKGYIGHTFGAAGIIESAIAIMSLQKNILLKTAGFDTTGVSSPVNILKSTGHYPLRNCLKTSSGFGGSNASILFTKESPPKKGDSGGY